MKRKKKSRDDSLPFQSFPPHFFTTVNVLFVADRVPDGKDKSCHDRNMRWFKDADGKTKFAPDFNLFSRKYFLLQKHVGCILNSYDMNTVKYTQKDKLQSFTIWLP